MATWLVTGGAGFIGGNFVLDAVRQRRPRRQPRCADLRRQPRHAGVAATATRTTCSCTATSASARWSRACWPSTGPTRWSTSPPRATSTVRSTARRRSCRPTWSARSACWRRRATTGSRSDGAGARRVPLPARLDRRGLRLARRHRQVHRGHAVRAELAVLGVEGRVRPPGARLPPHLRPAGPDHQLLEQLRSVPVPGKAHPADDRQGARRRAAAGLRRRHATCATGCTSATTAPRSARVLEAGRVGETYNVGGDAERQNIDVVQDDLRAARRAPSARRRPRRANR